MTFHHGVDLNMAQVLVQNRVNLAVPQLPEVIKQTGVTTRKRSPDILMGLALTSPDGRYSQSAIMRQDYFLQSFDVYESVDSPNEFSIVEGFTSKAAGDAHVKTDHFKDFLVWFPTVIGTAPQIINTEVDGWSRMNEFG